MNSLHISIDNHLWEFMAFGDIKNNGVLSQLYARGVKFDR